MTELVARSLSYIRRYNTRAIRPNEVSPVKRQEAVRDFTRQMTFTRKSLFSQRSPFFHFCVSQLLQGRAGFARIRLGSAQPIRSGAHRWPLLNCCERESDRPRRKHGRAASRKPEEPET